MAALWAVTGAAVAQGTAADKIAEIFASDDAQAQRKAEDLRKRDAERKAQDVLREQARKRADEALKIDRDRELQKAQVGPAKKAEPVHAPAVPTLDPPLVDPKAEESEMLTRARLEDEQRRQAEINAQAEDDARRAIEKIIAGSAPPSRDDAARTDPASPDVANARRAWEHSAARIAAQAEADVAARAQAVADAKRTFQRTTSRIAAQDKAEQERAVAEAAVRAKVVADAKRTWQRSTVRVAADDKAAADAAERVKTVAEARRAWQRSAARVAASEKAEAEAKTRSEVATAALPARDPPHVASGPAALEPRVTVLIVMEPGNRGIRRHNKKADPLLCVNDGCYISAGADAPARFMPGRQALGLANTWGGRAGACRNQLGCVFRGVAVADLPLVMQPVDMRVVKHDRRHMVAVSTDSHCRLEGPRLTCARGVVEDDYVIWIVPESLATAAGPTALERAVEDGLSGPQSAHVGGGRF